MTASSNSIYAECTLPVDERAIRVLDLMPGDESDEIHAHLRSVALDADPPPPYECISYVWGDPTYKKPAFVNGQSFPITKNLHDVLRHVRSNTTTIVVWADAICINQSDLDEKSQQVDLMAETYRKCSKVYIWLGLPDYESLAGNPFEYLEHYMRGKHVYDFPGFVRDKSTGRLIWKKNVACDNILDDFLQITESPWWTRAWTVQECLLAKDTTIMFGAWRATWDYFLKAIAMKNSHGDDRNCCEEASHVFNPHQLQLINNFLWHPGWIDRFQRIIREDGEPQPRGFYEALQSFSSRKCSNPRDKIYCMLSLARHPIYQDLKPNYREEVHVVYIDAFTRMVRETNDSFDCFMGGGFGSSMPGLPSWVRDFSLPKATGVIPGEERRIWYVELYRASLAQPCPIRWSECKELEYRGTYADKINAVGLPMLPSSSLTPGSEFSKVFHQWLDLCKEVVGTSEPTVLRNTFSRIICGDVCKTLEEGSKQFRRARETDFPENDAWCQLIDGDIYAMDHRGYGWGLNFAMWGRCFFTTHSGQMGLCYPNSLPGDEVWVMRGVRVPFILRPLERVHAGCASKHALVGDCFLNGIMNGELSENERLTERPICIL